MSHCEDTNPYDLSQEEHGLHVPVNDFPPVCFQSCSLEVRQHIAAWSPVTPAPFFSRPTCLHLFTERCCLVKFVPYIFGHQRESSLWRSCLGSNFVGNSGVIESKRNGVERYLGISACMLLFQMELLSCGQYIHELDRLVDLWPVEAAALILTHSKAAYPQRHKHRYTIIKIKEILKMTITSEVLKLWS